MLEMLVAPTFLIKNRKSATFVLQDIYFRNPHMLGYQLVYYLVLANENANFFIMLENYVY